MILFLSMSLVLAIQGGVRASTPCSEVIEARTGCYECGKSRLTTTNEQLPTVVKLAASPGDFPWSAAVFENRSSEWEYLCGGTLVSPQAVLTTAHSVTILGRNQPMNVSVIRVVLGKTQRAWNITEPSEIKRQVKEIIMHPDYKGRSSFYVNDIALLILDSKVPLSSIVMPACLDYDHSQLPLYENDAIGYMSSFGQLNETLKYGSSKVLSYEQCINKVHTMMSDLTPFVNTYKFCVGNGPVSLFQFGDGGAGFTVISQGLHYVMGIASVVMIRRSDTYSIGAMTNVSEHMDWLKNNLPE